MRKISFFAVEIRKLIFRLIAGCIRWSKHKRKQFLKKHVTDAEKNYLKRYLYVLDGLEKQPQQTVSEANNTIWVCWLQGEEQAPSIVKKCLASIRKYAGDKKVIVLTNENLRNYVEIPEYIYQKKNAGDITNTHFSDILRVSLLNQHGGMWIDATVLMSAPIPDDILSAPFFAMCGNTHLHNDSWFLTSVPGHILMAAMQKLLYEYWRYETRLLDYFLYHIFFDLMTENNPLCAEAWSKVPVYWAADCYDYESNFFHLYNQNILGQIFKKSSIHKLTYKYDKNKPLSGTFLGNLLSA